MAINNSYLNVQEHILIYQIKRQKPLRNCDKVSNEYVLFITYQATLTQLNPSQVKVQSPKCWLSLKLLPAESRHVED